MGQANAVGPTLIEGSFSSLSVVFLIFLPFFSAIDYAIK